jgi:hypothetical protein
MSRHWDIVRLTEAQKESPPAEANVHGEQQEWLRTMRRRRPPCGAVAASRLSSFSS